MDTSGETRPTGAAAEHFARVRADRLTGRQSPAAQKKKAATSALW